VHNSIHFNDGHLVSLDTKPERSDGRGIDDAQTVTLSTLDLEGVEVVGGRGDVERIIAPLAVDGARVGDASGMIMLDWK
jgi:hypothetical protein